MADHFKLNADFFPVSTQDLIPVDDLLKWGVLPLGFKKSGLFGNQKRLNLGMVNPQNIQAVRFVRDFLGNLSGSEKISLKIFQIDADEFLDVVHRVYGVSPKGASGVREASDLPSFGNPLFDPLGLDDSV